MSELEQQLAASIALLEARKSVERSNRMLAEVTLELHRALRENELLRARLRIVDLKLQRRPNLTVVASHDAC